MSSLNSQIINPLQHYTADVATAIIMGIGYHLFKRIKNYDDWSDEKQKKKEIKQKISSALEKWKYATTIEEYNAIIKSNHDCTDPIEILQRMTVKGIMPTIETYNALLLNCYLDSNNVAATKLKEEIFDQTGPVAPNNYTLNILIKGLSYKYVNLQKANPENIAEINNNFDEELVEIIQSLEQRQIFMDVFAQNSILDALVETNRLDDAWCQYTNMKSIFQVDYFTYTTILKGIKKSTELTSEWLDRAFGIIEEACVGNELEENLYNLLLDSCVKFNKVDKAEVLFNQIKNILERTNKPLSQFTASIMIKAYGKVYKFGKALEMFETIKALHTTANTTTYSTMINAAIRCKNLEKAEQFLNEMKENSIPINLYIYSILLTGYRQSKRFDSAISLYDKVLNSKEIELNTVFFNSILESTIELQDYEKMDQVYNQFRSNFAEKENYAKPDLKTYCILIKGYSKSGNTSKVNDIYNFIRQEKEFKLDEYIYTSMFECFVKKADEEGSMKIYVDMKKNGIKICVASYGQLIKLFCSGNNFNKAFEIFEDCIKSDVKPNVIMYMMLIKCQIKNGFIDRAITLFNSMSVNEVKPDIPIYELMIKACVKNDRELEAMELTIKCTKSGMKLDNFIYNQIIDTIIQTRFLKLHEKHDGLIKLYTEIKVKQFELEIEHRTLQKLTTFIYKNEIIIQEKKKKAQNSSHPQIKPSENQSIMSNSSGNERSIYEIAIEVSATTPRNQKKKVEYPNMKSQPRDYNKKDAYYGEKYHNPKPYNELCQDYNYHETQEDQYDEYQNTHEDYHHNYQNTHEDYHHNYQNKYENQPRENNKLQAQTPRNKGPSNIDYNMNHNQQAQTPRNRGPCNIDYNMNTTQQTQNKPKPKPQNNQNKPKPQNNQNNQNNQTGFKGGFQYGDLNGESLYSKAITKKKK